MDFLSVLLDAEVAEQVFFRKQFAGMKKIQLKYAEVKTKWR